MTYEKVLTFWFSELKPKQWFVKDIALDSEIRSRFLETYKQACAGELFHWRNSAEGRLAEIIVLDQFARNIFRDQPESFKADPLALVLAQEAVAAGKDKDITVIQRAFMYMPYMHSESLKIHDEALKLFNQPGLENNLDFEKKHKAIIERFQRYPHRNKILGRASTPEELAFLEGPDSSF